MKILISISIVFLIMFAYFCSDTTNSSGNLYKSAGIITSYDYRKCKCCGGWFIDIGDSTYRFLELPKECNINFEKDTLPIAVKLDWKKSTTPCMGDEIIVERMKK
jgi:hypothetical protein